MSVSAVSLAERSRVGGIWFGTGQKEDWKSWKRGRKSKQQTNRKVPPEPPGAAVAVRR